MHALVELAHDPAWRVGVLVTIHQPRVEIMECFDDVAIIHSGRLRFFGSPTQLEEHVARNSPAMDAPVHEREYRNELHMLSRGSLGVRSRRGDQDEMSNYDRQLPSNFSRTRSHSNYADAALDMVVAAPDKMTFLRTMSVLGDSGFGLLGLLDEDDEKEADDQSTTQSCAAHTQNGASDIAASGRGQTKRDPGRRPSMGSMDYSNVFDVRRFQMQHNLTAHSLRKVRQRNEVKRRRLALQEQQEPPKAWATAVADSAWQLGGLVARIYAERRAGLAFDLVVVPLTFVSFSLVLALRDRGIAQVCYT